MYEDSIRMKDKPHTNKDTFSKVSEKENDENVIYKNKDIYFNDYDDTVPEEIDTHFQIYGKHAWEVEYGEACPICNKRIDEYGFCACGSQGG
jgi:hypothetical protein